MDSDCEHEQTQGWCWLCESQWQDLHDWSGSHEFPPLFKMIPNLVVMISSAEQVDLMITLHWILWSAMIRIQMHGRSWPPCHVPVGAWVVLLWLGGFTLWAAMMARTT